MKKLLLLLLLIVVVAACGGSHKAKDNDPGHECWAHFHKGASVHCIYKK